MADMTYTFTRSGSTINPLTVNFSVGGTATYNNDWTVYPINNGGKTYTINATQGTIQIKQGQASETLVVSTIPDNVLESDETIIFTIQTDPAYTIGPNNTATGTILNDD